MALVFEQEDVKCGGFFKHVECASLIGGRMGNSVSTNCRCVVAILVHQRVPYPPLKQRGRAWVYNRTWQPKHFFNYVVSFKKMPVSLHCEDVYFFNPCIDWRMLE